MAIGYPIDSENYWEHVFPTYIENWPKELYNLSIPQVNVPLGMPKAFLKCLERVQNGEDLTKLEWSYLHALEHKIEKAGKVFLDGFFIRLGSRSPKDSWVGIDQGFKCTNGRWAMTLLLDSMERIWEDVSLAIKHDYKPQIWLRQWIDIPEWAEFRCLMRDKELIGISQYNYLNGQCFDEVADNADSLQSAIEQFFTGSFLPVIHLASVIFDVWVERHDNDWRVKLLEINPFGPWTDPCLFSWENSEDFDGTLRYVKESFPYTNLDSIMEG